MKKILVVDGSNLLFQMFYGMPARIVNHQGKAIHAALGFIGALLKMIRMVEPSHVVVVFDGEYVTERTRIDADYKGNRPDYSQMRLEETPFSQLPDIYAALDHLGICHRETVECEADDWIAGYARQCGVDSEVIIVSQDSDFFQLITERVRILRYRGKKSVLCGPEWLHEKLGIRADQYAAYKSLTGDHADNICGAEKVGPKTAAALMAQFGDIDTLFCRAQEIKKPSVRESVLRCEQRIRNNYRLIALDGAKELPFTEKELCYQYDGSTTMQVLCAIGLR